MENKKCVEFEINPIRLRYILDLYNLSQEEFIFWFNGKRKRELMNLERLNRILEKKEKVNSRVLKKIDSIFKKGLTWYISSRDLPEKKESSIFFRKDSFNSELNFESKKRIADYEELKFEVQSLCKQINFKPNRILKQYDLSDRPEIAAKEVLKQFNEVEEKLLKKKYIKKASEDRDYLSNLMGVIEQFNIFVFEFVDRNKLSEKVICFNGFFMKSNLIVIKRQQKYLRREIFTLLHELAHYLLCVEEIDEDVEVNNVESLNVVEQWCNTFAYSFLINGCEEEFSQLTYASVDNDFYRDEIREIRNNTYLSEFALFTRLKIECKISNSDYTQIKNEIISNIKKRQGEEKILFEEKKLNAEKQEKNLFIRGPVEIKSNLFEEVVKSNFFEGKISETKLREYLKIKPNKSIEEAVY